MIVAHPFTYVTNVTAIGGSYGALFKSHISIFHSVWRVMLLVQVRMLSLLVRLVKLVAAIVERVATLFLLRLIWIFFNNIGNHRAGLDFPVGVSVLARAAGVRMSNSRSPVTVLQRWKHNNRMRSYDDNA
jgi:hypothetical protein